MEVSGELHTQEREPGTHWTEDWLDAVEKRKIPSPCRDSNPSSSSAVPLSYSGSMSMK
jgi:hypothetical protein